MTNYIEALKKELNKTHLKQKEIDDVLSDHEEMIKEAMADGVLESDLEKHFGSPKDVASQLESENREDDIIDHIEDHETFKPETKDFKCSIQLINEDVHLGLSNDLDVHVSFSNQKTKNQYEVLFVDNHLTIKRKNERKIISFKADDQEITVLVPKEIMIDMFTLNIVNGDVHLKDVEIKYAKLNFVNGDLEMAHLAIESLSLHAVGGDVSMKQMSMTECHISEVSGDVDMYAVDILHDFKVSTVSGDINLEKTTCDLLTFHTVSGDLKGKACYPKAIRLESISGDINIKNDEKRDIKIIKSSTVSGDITIE